MSTTVVKREVGPTGSASGSSSNPASPPKPSGGGGGINPEAIQKRLAAALPTVGVQGASGQGRAGRPDAGAYHSLIRATLERNWIKPTGSNPNQEALVKVRISPDGSLTALGVTRSSGDPALDASALEAVRRTGKLPQPLPEGLGTPDYEVVVNFKLD